MTYNANSKQNSVELAKVRTQFCYMILLMSAQMTLFSALQFRPCKGVH